MLLNLIAVRRDLARDPGLRAQLDALAGDDVAVVWVADHEAAGRAIEAARGRGELAVGVEAEAWLPSSNRDPNQSPNGHHHRGSREPSPAGFAHLGLIVAGVVHDLRSPLSLMISRAELAREQLDELDLGAALASGSEPESLRRELEALRDNLVHIEAHGRIAADLVHSVLSMAGGSALDAVVVSLDTELRRLVELFRPASAVSVALDLSAGDAAIEIGPRDLARILLNLLHNAQQAVLGAGSGDLCQGQGQGQAGEISIATRAHPDGVELSVTDSGQGVAIEDRGRIFDPSYSTTGGTGLGLAVVERLARTHGATIELDAAHVGGARFVLMFPRAS